MKPLKPLSSELSLIVDSITHIRHKGPLSSSTFDSPNNHKIEAFCLLCPSKHCLSTKNKTGQTIDLCPTNSISLRNNSKSVEIAESCISCGLCVAACPIGAIQVDEVGNVAPRLNTSEIPTEPVNANIWENWISTKLQEVNLHENEIAIASNFFSEKCIHLKGNHFYKIVESILRLLGHDAIMSNLGDTNNRIDLIIRTPSGNVPVEIKSYTETPTINWKSVQQAIENKLLITRLDQQAKMSSLSTLVVGFAYPSERTGIEEHIKEIEAAFGIRIGVLSLPKLWELLLSKKFNYDSKNEVDISKIVGLL